MIIFSTILSTVYAVDLKDLRPQTQGLDPVLSMIFIAVIVLIAGAAVANKILGNQKLKVRDQKVKDANVAFKFEQLEISKEDQETIQTLSEISEIHPADLIWNNQSFEKAVETLPSDSPILKKTPHIREILGFTFANQGAKFVKTQMLQSGQKIRVTIPHPKKSLSFVSSIINNTEDSLWVKPPQMKGKTANLKSFKHVELNVFRQNDAEYRFLGVILTQVSSPVQALILKHTDKIDRLYKRNADRFLIQFSLNLSIISQGVAPGKRHGAGTMSSVKVEGEVDDLSIGGMKYGVKVKTGNMEVGDIALFKLPQMNIKKEIQAKIVAINDKHIHLQFSNLKELDRLYINRYIENQNGKKKV